MVKNNKLPNEIIPFLSSDKNWHQKPDYSDLANFPSPINAVICGNRNCGKSRLMKNLLIHKNPPYTRIVVYTPLEETFEYNDCDVTYINEIPPLDFFDRDERNIMIIEDTDTKSLSKDQRSLLGRYYSVFGSHNQIDLYTICQNPSDIMPQLRRISNVVILFKNNDLELLSMLAKKFNLKANELHAIFATFTQYDSLLLDDTRESKYRLRKNLYQIIELE